jgi:hypothetical protein
VIDEIRYQERYDEKLQTSFSKGSPVRLIKRDLELDSEETQDKNNKNKKSKSKKKNKGSPTINLKKQISVSKKDR